MANPIRQAIETKLLRTTNHRGARIKAMSQAGTITLGYDYALSFEGNNREAAMALVRKLEWGTISEWIGGQLASGNYAFIRI